MITILIIIAALVVLNNIELVLGLCALALYGAFWLAIAGGLVSIIVIVGA